MCRKLREPQACLTPPHSTPRGVGRQACWCTRAPQTLQKSSSHCHRNTEGNPYLRRKWSLSSEEVPNNHRGCCLSPDRKKTCLYNKGLLKWHVENCICNNFNKYSVKIIKYGTFRWTSISPNLCISVSFTTSLPNCLYTLCLLKYAFLNVSLSVYSGYQAFSVLSLEAHSVQWAVIQPPQFSSVLIRPGKNWPWSIRAWEKCFREMTWETVKSWLHCCSSFASIFWVWGHWSTWLSKCGLLQVIEIDTR